MKKECELCGVFIQKDMNLCNGCIVEKEKDIINTPSHYTKWGIEPIDFSISNNLSFCEGNVIKYVTRYKHKNGLEDLKKAEFYIKRLIQDYENKI